MTRTADRMLALPVYVGLKRSRPMSAAGPAAAKAAPWT